MTCRDKPARLEKGTDVKFSVAEIPKERKKRIVHRLPCLSFGSTEHRIATLQENHSKLLHNKTRLARNVQHLRSFGKPTVGEQTLYDKQDKQRKDKSKRVKNSDSLLLVCQKVEYVKNVQRSNINEPFTFNIPAFPPREQFVFRSRYQNPFPSNFFPRLNLRRFRSEKRICL